MVATIKQEVQAFLFILQTTEEGIEREMYGYRFKHQFFTDVGLFSTAHNGNWTGNFLDVLLRKETWEDITVIDGKRVVMEYERNFNTFVSKIKAALV